MYRGIQGWHRAGFVFGIARSVIDMDRLHSLIVGSDCSGYALGDPIIESIYKIASLQQRTEFQPTLKGAQTGNCPFKGVVADGFGHLIQLGHFSAPLCHPLVHLRIQSCHLRPPS